MSCPVERSEWQRTEGYFLSTAGKEALSPASHEELCPANNHVSEPEKTPPLMTPWIRLLSPSTPCSQPCERTQARATRFLIHRIWERINAVLSYNTRFGVICYIAKTANAIGPSIILILQTVKLVTHH